MKKWKERWNKLLPYEKKCEVSFWMLICVVAIVFAFSIFGKPVAFDFYVLEIGLVLLALTCYMVAYWRTERSSAKSMIPLAIWFAITLIWEIIKLFI